MSGGACGFLHKGIPVWFEVEISDDGYQVEITTPDQTYILEPAEARALVRLLQSVLNRICDMPLGDVDPQALISEIETGLNDGN